jgi:heme-degrading monooxygenase HmoA
MTQGGALPARRPCVATVGRYHPIMTLGHHLAQVNIALPLEPLTSDRLADFVRLLDPVNELADRAEGFVWRLTTEDGDATGVRAFGDDRIIVNLTVWESLETLKAFVFETLHREVMARRREWFELITQPYTVAWWVPAGHLPAVAEAEDRLARLRAHGPGPEAFTLRRTFPPPAEARSA